MAGNQTDVGLLLTKDELRAVIREALGEAQELGEPLMTTEQAAEYLGVNENTLRIWSRDERDPIPHVVLKSSRHKRYRRKELDAWSERRAGR